MIVAGGPDGEVYLPAIYPATRQAGDEQLRLGRGTGWLGDEGQPVRGLGQRMFLIGDQDRSIMQLTEVTFAAAAAAGD